MPATTESLRALLTPVIAASGWELDELSISPAGRRSVLRVTVDGDVPIDLDAVADLSRDISAALDGADAFGTRPYVLEVSSPGVERPLTERRHWRRATGRLVEVVPVPGGGGGASLTGRLLAVGEQAITLDIDGTPRELAYDQVARARVQVEFRRREADGPDVGADDDADDLDADDREGDDLETDEPGDDDPETDDPEDSEGEDRTSGTVAAVGHSEGGTPWTST